MKRKILKIRIIKGVFVLLIVSAFVFIPDIYVNRKVMSTKTEYSAIELCMLAHGNAYPSVSSKDRHIVEIKFSKIRSVYKKIWLESWCNKNFNLYMMWIVVHMIFLSGIYIYIFLWDGFRNSIN